MKCDTNIVAYIALFVEFFFNILYPYPYRNFKFRINSKLNIKDLSQLSIYLSVNVVIKNNYIYKNKYDFVDAILERHSMPNSK